MAASSGGDKAATRFFTLLVKQEMIGLYSQGGWTSETLGLRFGRTARAVRDVLAARERIMAVHPLLAGEWRQKACTQS